MIDLTQGAAQRIGMIHSGVAPVKVTVRRRQGQTAVELLLVCSARCEWGVTERGVPGWRFYRRPGTSLSPS